VREDGLGQHCVHFYCPHTVRSTLWIVGKDSYIWLVALRILQWPTVYLSHQFCDSPLADNILAHWHGALHFHASPLRPNLLVFSCLLRHLEENLASIPNHFPVLGMLSELPRCVCSLRHSLDEWFGLQWHLVKHQDVGGVTNHSVWFVGRFPGISGTPSLTKLPSHTLGAIVDYGPYLPSTTPDPTALPLASLIPVHQLDCKICLLNCFSSASESSSFLTSKEIYSAWDLPDWITRPATRLQAVWSVSTLPPFKGLLAMADSVGALLPITRLPIQACSLPRLSPSTEDARGIYLPEVS